jgi:ABC-type enterochelin transport system permease subunit
MTLLIIFLVWYISGMLSTVIFLFWIQRYIKVRDVVLFPVVSCLGLIFFVATVYYIFDNYNIWDITLWQKKDGRG